MKASGVKQQVRRTLRQFPQARRDNRTLVLLIWRQQGLPISLEEALNPDRFWQPESIRRARAKIQNDEGQLKPEDSAQDDEEDQFA